MQKGSTAVGSGHVTTGGGRGAMGTSTPGGSAGGLTGTGTSTGGALLSTSRWSTPS